MSRQTGGVAVAAISTKINIQLSRHAQCICQRNDSKSFVLGSGQTDLRESDFTVQAMLTLFALTAVTKFSGSDGSNPLKNNCTRQPKPTSKRQAKAIGKISSNFRFNV
jgi:hypothetical protein